MSDVRPVEMHKRMVPIFRSYGEGKVANGVGFSKEEDLRVEVLID